MFSKRLEIIKPTFGGHEGSCFRELLELWKENDLCDIQYNTIVYSKYYEKDITKWPESRVWINNIGDILLYDNPLLDKIPNEWNYGLFANEIYKSNKSSNWIFWVRWPKKYEKFKKENAILKFEERGINSIFIGNLTTRNRMGRWGQFIDCYVMGSYTNNKQQDMIFDYENYLKNIHISKFGLSLPGVGPKCLRDIEYMGLGVVPIFSKNVSNDYYNKLEEGRHFFRIEAEEEIRSIINTCTKERWEYMSNECIKWYEKNSSIEGSYKTTIEILEKNGIL